MAETAPAVIEGLVHRMATQTVQLLEMTRCGLAVHKIPTCRLVKIPRKSERKAYKQTRATEMQSQAMILLGMAYLGVALVLVLVLVLDKAVAAGELCFPTPDQRGHVIPMDNVLLGIRLSHEANRMTTRPTGSSNLKCS
jgi:hypothetical protein